MTAGHAVAVGATVTAACIYAISGVVQHRVTHDIPRPDSQLQMLLMLARRPAWVLSVAGALVGLGLQVLALQFGPLGLVQPILVSNVLFATVAGFVIDRRPVDWMFMLEAVLCVGGLAAFLLLAQPRAAGEALTLRDFVPITAGFGGLTVVAVAMGFRTSQPWRQLLLAFATGLLYGLTAGIVKVVLAQLGDGLGAVLTHWSLYTLAVLGPAGFILSQIAFREGPLAAPALAVVTVVDPLASIGIGLVGFGEIVRTGGLLVPAEVASLAAMSAGVYMLAHRAPQVAAQGPNDDEPTRTTFD